MGEPSATEPRSSTHTVWNRVRSLRLRAAAADATFVDPVEEWKRIVRTRVVDEERAKGRRPMVRFRVTLRFVALTGSLVLLGTTALLTWSFSGAPVLAAALLLAGTSCANVARERWRESYDARSNVDAVARAAEWAMSEGDARRAQHLATHGLATALASRSRQRLWTTLAWTGIALGDPLVTHEALLRLYPNSISLHLVASYLSSCNRVEEAVELLLEMRALGHRSTETTKLLVDLLFRRGERQAVLALALADTTILSLDELRTIRSAVARSLP